MIKIKFTYNEPGIGELEYNGGYKTDEELIAYIEGSFPTYTDIEITKIES
jgi:hypothetical protein